VNKVVRKTLAVLIAVLACTKVDAADRPNVLWITCEDINPNLGCYGDDYAVTPNLDALAARGLRYTNASSNAPVCAPARTTIISGLYPPSTGAEHMRSLVRLPERFRMFPRLLREAGYHTTNNSKEDYNLETTGHVWDESSPRAHWKNRGAGQPFFSVFNFTITHESQIRNAIGAADRIHDPAKVHLPAYHPDTPEVRRDWAQYYDRITMMDKQTGALLQELETSRLANDTIVFFFSDHGSGMPRSKRTACNSGLNVPFVVYFPPKWQHLAPKEYSAGGTSDRLISFVDLAPTMLSLAGMEPPEWLQGSPFCGKFELSEPKFSFGFRGRMDERYDLVRSVRDKQFMYVRNFMPHRPHGQHNAYMFETPTTRVWRKAFDDGKLNAVQSQFWQPKAVEELYDLSSDHDEVNNLAASPEHRATMNRMRKALGDWEHRIKDVDLLSEWEMHDRSRGSTPYDLGHDPKKYDFDAVYAAASSATSLKPVDLPMIRGLLNDKDSAVRYWGAIGLLTQGKAGVEAGRDELVAALHDGSPIVRITAAEALGRYGDEPDTAASLKVLLHFARPEANAFLGMAAWNALDYLDERARPAEQALRELSPDPIKPPPRYGDYGRRLKQKTLADLQ
jgi:arylsulfatase A-like enzyme